MGRQLETRETLRTILRASVRKHWRNPEILVADLEARLAPYCVKTKEK